MALFVSCINVSVSISDCVCFLRKTKSGAINFMGFRNDISVEEIAFQLILLKAICIIIYQTAQNQCENLDVFSGKPNAK